MTMSSKAVKAQAPTPAGDHGDRGREQRRSDAAERNARLLEREQEIALAGGGEAHQERGGRRRDETVPQAHHDRARDQQNRRGQRHEEHAQGQANEPCLVRAAGADPAAQIGETHETGCLSQAHEGDLVADQRRIDAVVACDRGRHGRHHRHRHGRDGVAEEKGGYEKGQ
jgi:hypothetical protein